MSFVRYPCSLAVVSFGLLFGSQKPAYALPLDLGRADLTGNKPLSWAVLNALASSHLGTNSLPSCWQAQMLPTGPTADSVAWGAPEGSREECYLGRAESSVSNWLNDLGRDLPLHARHSHGVHGPVPVIPPSRGEHLASDGLMIRSPAFRPHPMTRFVRAEEPLAPAPYLTSLLRPPKARFSLEAPWL
jgi:hypothetical protein